MAASRLPVVPISDENRDGDRTLASSGKVDSVSTVSACIASKVEGVASTVANKSRSHKIELNQDFTGLLYVLPAKTPKRFAQLPTT